MSVQDVRSVNSGVSGRCSRLQHPSYVRSSRIAARCPAEVWNMEHGAWSLESGVWSLEREERCGPLCNIQDARRTGLHRKP
eukprot:2701225-Rhodomonas_salina.1